MQSVCIGDVNKRLMKVQKLVLIETLILLSVLPPVCLVPQLVQQVMHGGSRVAEQIFETQKPV